MGGTLSACSWRSCSVRSGSVTINWIGVMISFVAKSPILYSGSSGNWPGERAVNAASATSPSQNHRAAGIANGRLELMASSDKDETAGKQVRKIAPIAAPSTFFLPLSEDFLLIPIPVHPSKK